MMTFSEFLASQRNARVPAMPQVDAATAATFATPGKEDTKRAIERAAKRGRSVTPDDLKACISPESVERAQRAVQPRLSRP